MEEKYIPSMEGLSIEEKTGIAASQKKLSERRFERFQAVMEEMKERGLNDEAGIKMVKNLRRDTKETTDRMEEITTMPEGRNTKKLKDKISSM